MATSNTTSTAGNKTNSGAAAAAASATKAKRVPKAKRDDVIVVGKACVAQIDAMAQTLQQQFGFKPTAEQTIGYLMTSAAKAAAKPEGVSLTSSELAANPIAKANAASWPGADKAK